MERSKFEKLLDPQLRKYGLYVKSIIKGERDLLSDINEFYQFIIYSKTEGSRKIMSPVGGSLNMEDIEYLFYILKYNDLEVEGPLDRPVRTIESVDFVYDERVFRTVRKTGDIETYLSNDLSNGYLMTLKDENKLDPWYWRTIDEEENDWDVRDFWFDV